MVLPKQLTTTFNIRNRKKAVIMMTLNGPVKLKQKKYWKKRVNCKVQVQGGQKLISDYFRPMNGY
jgi:hypothetical protein